MANRTVKIIVNDMHCTSCEIRIENHLKKIKGINEVKADYSKSRVTVTFEQNSIAIGEIIEQIGKAGYTGVLENNNVKGSNSKSDKIKFMGIGVIILAVYLIIENTIGFNYIPEVQKNAGYGLLFIVGILTSLHCIAMCGGIAISQSIKRNESNCSEKKFDRFKPALLYNTGRLISYTALGGIAGGLGSIVSLSGQFKGVIAIAAGIFMIVMGVNMLGIFPWLKIINIRMPKIFGKKLYSGANNRSPFIIGILNGFMPCGPLQTMQLYALGTGSVIAGALSMFVFTLGTMPLMTAFSFLTSILSSKFTSRMLKVSASLVIMLGIVMANRGLALSGISTPNFGIGVGAGNAAGTTTINAEIVDGKQIMKMAANRSGYTPNVFFVQKGVPVKWVVKGEQLDSCNNEIVVPKYKIQKKLSAGENTIEFTPRESGNIAFSCWMGMIRGTIKVVDDVSKVTDQERQDEQDNNPRQAGGSCCSGAVSQGPITENDVAFGTYDGTEQSIVMNVDINGYSPRVVAVQKGKPVNFTIKAKDLNSCNYALIFPDAGYQKTLKEGDNVIKFNPDQSGILSFTCPMGMLYGNIIIVDDIKKVSKQDILKLAEQAPAPSGGGC